MIKYIFNEIKKDPKVIYYYFKGQLLWLLFGKFIKRWYLKSLECRRCFKTGICQKGCGSCDFNKVAISGIKCTPKIEDNGIEYWEG